MFCKEKLTASWMLKSTKTYKCERHDPGITIFPYAISEANDANFVKFGTRRDKITTRYTEVLNNPILFHSNNVLIIISLRHARLLQKAEIFSKAIKYSLYVSTIAIYPNLIHTFRVLKAHVRILDLIIICRFVFA